MSASPIAIEICLEDIDSAIAAEAGGADRIELCAGLIEGGTTPSRGLIKTVRKHAAIDLHVLIRPRGGGFCYSERELEAMEDDIDGARALGAQGVVFGALTPDGDVDLDAARRLILSAHPLRITFHRAFDRVRDPRAALEALIGLGIERVLTSGQAPSALAGLARLAELHAQAAGRIAILAAGGVSAENARRIVEVSGVRELHAASSVAEWVESPMPLRNPGVALGTAPGAGEHRRRVVSAAKVRELTRRVRAG